VPVGTLGAKVLLTNLANRILPLIRYEMADQVAYRSDPCGCGSLLPRISNVAGRVEHMLALPGPTGGVVQLIPEHLDEYLGPCPGIATYQVIQDGPARLTLNYVARSGAEMGDLAAALQRCFDRYGVDAHQVQVDPRAVPALEPVRPGATKVCHFWNRWTAK
jgi:phenylacetate-coenzyme A ligase PaaK-like adenylate-forming protein